MTGQSWRHWGGLAAALAVGVVVGVINSLPAADEAEKAKTESKPAAKTEAAPPAAEPDIYPVPEGKPEEILEFLNKIRSDKKFKSREEALAHAIKVQWTIAAAADKMLGQEIDEDTALAAAEMKFEALLILAVNDIPGAMTKALAAAKAMQKDEREDIAEAAQEAYTQLQIFRATQLDEAGRNEIIDEILGELTTSKFAGTAVGKAMQLGEVLEQLDNSHIAGDYYAKLAELIKNSGKRRLDPLVVLLQGNVRRLKLPGNEMQVIGTTLDGKPFAWDKYRGKVVLVDFWATWCGPCLEELPNVKENYTRYHDQGFEVVGISLDTDKDELQQFLKDQDVPWVNLFAEPKDGEEESRPPTADYYGITGIPTAILVGRDGKVISLMARGEILTALLDKLMADKPVKSE